jgi:hypothetical protein
MTPVQEGFHLVISGSHASLYDIARGLMFAENGDAPCAVDAQSIASADRSEIEHLRAENVEMAASLKRSQAIAAEMSHAAAKGYHDAANARAAVSGLKSEWDACATTILGEGCLTLAPWREHAEALQSRLSLAETAEVIANEKVRRLDEEVRSVRASAQGALDESRSEIKRLSGIILQQKQEFETRRDELTSALDAAAKPDIPVVVKEELRKAAVKRAKETPPPSPQPSRPVAVCELQPGVKLASAVVTRVPPNTLVAVQDAVIQSAHATVSVPLIKVAKCIGSLRTGHKKLLSQLAADYGFGSSAAVKKHIEAIKPSLEVLKLVVLFEGSGAGEEAYLRGTA